MILEIIVYLIIFIVFIWIILKIFNYIKKGRKKHYLKVILKTKYGEEKGQKIYSFFRGIGKTK